MSEINKTPRTRAQESTNAIEKLYISMRHLFSRGFYKPMGISGEALRKSLLLLRPVNNWHLAICKTKRTFC